jgi:hypothetical protein
MGMGIARRELLASGAALGLAGPTIGVSPASYGKDDPGQRATKPLRLQAAGRR